AFVAVALTSTVAIEVALRRRGAPLPLRPGFALVLTTHSAVLGVAIMAEARAPNIGRALLFSFTTPVPFAALSRSFATLYQPTRHAGVPGPFRNAPIALITAGLMALGCMGFQGLIQE